MTNGWTESMKAIDQGVDPLTSLTLSLSIEVPVPSQKSELSC